MRTEFTAKTKLQAFQRANGTCERAGCGAKLTPCKFTYDHIIPDQLGGDNSLENCQVICSVCDKEKTRHDQGDIAKAKRRERRAAGIKKPRTIRAWRRFNGAPVYADRDR